MNDRMRKWKRIIMRQLLDKTLYVSAAVEVAKSISYFASTKSPLSFLEGGVGIVNVLAQEVCTWSSDFFNAKHGWEMLVSASSHKPVYDVLTPILDEFPSKTLNFNYNNTQSMAKIYTLPDGKQVGKDHFGLWHYFEESKKEDVLSFLYNEAYNSIHSNVFSIVEREQRGEYGDDKVSKFTLKSEELHSIPSPAAEKYKKHIQAALDKGINRSVMFIGFPGTGKSSMVNTIINDLGLRTLKFKYNPESSDMVAIEEIIDALKVEALILDDLDTVEDSIDLLGFLERMHEKLKLTVGIVNSIKGFNVAITRPARFDEIITINNLDPTVVRQILGKKYARLFPRVKNFPVAFLNELMQRIEINPKLDINKNIIELNARVKNQIKVLDSEMR